jgi:hypothetical protein
MKGRNVNSVLLLAALVMPLSAGAACSSAKPEPFGKFLQAFGEDKRFAVTRTVYPLDYHDFVDDGVQEGRMRVTKRIEKDEDAGYPAIAVFARDNDVALATTSVKKAEAIVQMAKPGTDSLVLKYFFVRQRGCWYLRRIEDHSL